MKMMTWLQTRRNRIAGRLTLVAIGLLAFSLPVEAQRNQRRDFLNGEIPGQFARITHDGWNLGPIGAFGFPDNTTERGFSESFMIREVLPGSPADGQLTQYDVILGVVSPLEGQAKLAARPGRRGYYILESIGLAIETAEKQDGRIVLKVFRPETESASLPGNAPGAFGPPPASWAKLVEPFNGQEIEVTLTIPVTGAYSATAPWECAKTKAIIDGHARSIVERNFSSRGGGYAVASNLDALGLLATGEAQYLPVLQRYARGRAKRHEGLNILTMDNPETLNTWGSAYELLFLAEYYIATGDEEVVRGLTDLATATAMGRSGVGTYSHSMSYINYFGLYGPASAYGAMNQCSITMNMALLVAFRGGIRNQEIYDAIAIGATFLRQWVDMGTIPYGDNPAWMDHDDNGRNSQAAVFFDILGHQPSAEYFSRQTLASYRRRTDGHTGHFFNSLWGPLGAARGGDEAAQAFMQKMRWYPTLERRVDGDAIFNGPGRYTGWSTDGVHLLHHCLPRKAIHITGKGGSSIPPFSTEKIEESFATANYFRESRNIVDEMTVPELLQELGSFNPLARDRVADELKERGEDVADQLVAMLKGPDRHARYGALLALNRTGRIPDEAVDEMLRILREERNFPLRRYASGALGRVRDARGREKVMPAMLQLVADYQTGDSVTPENFLEDRLNLGIADRAFSIVYGDNIWRANENSFEGVDRDLIYPALRSMLVNPLGPGRAIDIINRFLDAEEQAKFLGAIYLAVKNPPPSSNSVGWRMTGVRLLADNRIAEAAPMAYRLMKESTHGNYWRRPAALEALSRYDMATLDPYMEQMKSTTETHRKRNLSRNHRQQLDRAWKRIEENKGKTIPTQSIQPFLDAMQR